MPDESSAGDAGHAGDARAPTAQDPPVESAPVPEQTEKSPDAWVPSAGSGPGGWGYERASAADAPDGPPGHYGQGQGPYGQGQGPYGQGGGPYGQGGGPYGQGAYGYAPYGYGSAQSQGPYDPYSQGHYDPYSHYQEQSHAYAWPYTPPRPARTPEERRRRTKRALALAGVLVLAVGAGIGIGAAIAPTNPTTSANGLVRSSVAAAIRAGSYHYSERSIQRATNVSVPDDITGDATRDGGRQVISERCAAGTNIFDLRLVHGVVYFRGNGPAVVDQLGVPTTRATADVNRWVKVTKGEVPYRSFAEGITTKSNISQLKTTIVARTSKRVAGSPPSTEILGGLYNGKGKAPVGTATLVVTASSNLPRTLNGDAVGSTGSLTLTWTFTHFGESIDVSKPADVIGYTSLRAGKPSKTACG